jgi:primosomal protein N' (replication factor Y) (superfamily II helicase)
VYGDVLLRAEEEYLRRAEAYQTRGETPKRIELPGTMKIVNVSRETDTADSYTLFSPEVIEAIKKVRKRRGRMFLYAARRGLAPVVACIDCGHIFRSPQSGAPYSLIRTRENEVEKRWFVCSASGEKIPAPDLCPLCSSWRLRERGIGIQHVYDELHKIFPSIPVVLFDHISAKTYTKAVFLRDTFYKSKRGIIMLGTSMAVPYLTQDVDLSVVVNMDALLATPTWRLEEENLALLLSLREITQGQVMVQTRATQTEILAHAMRGSVESFYTEELELRKKFGYPPYSVFIHLTWQGTPEVVKQTEEIVLKILEKYNPSTYPHPTSPEHKPILYGLIRLPAEKWPDLKLITALRSLPSSVRLMINPDKII